MDTRRIADLIEALTLLNHPEEPSDELETALIHAERGNLEQAAWHLEAAAEALGRDVQA
ncbi:MAG: hypothetical protein AAGF92_24540 [Myxococcota bacterium]